MLFYLGTLNLFTKALPEEGYKVTDNYSLECPYWPILFILEWMMLIRFGKAPLHINTKLEACQRQNLSSL